MTNLIDTPTSHPDDEAGPPLPPPAYGISTAPQPAGPPPRRGRLLGAIAATALLAGAGGAAVGVAITRNDTSTAAPASQPTVTAAGSASEAPRAPQLLDTTSIVARTTPSVVSIRVTSTGTDVFQQQITQEGTGTGFVASADGLIYTNAHVVADADTVRVTLADGTTKDGKVIGVASTVDLAVVKIDAGGLVPLPIGSSANMKVGDPVVAVGNALALTGGPTATLGIVSALNRSIDTNNGEHLSRLIQTDAAINPGNSGGPLLNAAGEVIGINTAGASNAENVGFAIALDTAKPILEQLSQGKTPVRAFLGVQTQTVDRAAADQLNLSVQAGAYVAAVTADSGADLAGLQVGDVITKVDGVQIASSGDLGTELVSRKPGDSVTLTVRRGDKDIAIEAKLGSRQA